MESERANCGGGEHHNDEEREMTEVKNKVQPGISEITITYPGFPFEGIFSGGGDGDGGYVCFLCGRGMERGESFTCVSRLLETWEGSEAKPSVIEAVASLQVCLPCTLLSAHHRLKWTHNPRLTEVEVQAFQAYARLLAETISRTKSDTRIQKETAENLLGDAPYFPVELDRVALLGGTYHGNPVSIISDGRCLRCHDTINPSKPHIAFEISVDTPRRDGMTKSYIWRLGGYCPECSKQLLPLCDRLW